MNQNFLVIGGTGKTGRKVVNGLLERNQNVRVGTRSQNPPFDWDDSSTWAKALEGMDKVYIVFYPDLAVPGARQAIEGLTREAVQGGVQKLVLLSGKGEREAELCEEVVMNSGRDYTIVRASWFNQNFSESFLLEPILRGHVALPMPQARIPFVDTGDIADVVVEVLMNDQHNGKIYQLTGPRTMTFDETIEEISKATDRDIKYESVSIEAYKNIMQAAGLPRDYVWLFEYLFTEVLGNEKNAEITSDIEKVLGRKAKDFSEYARETAQSGIWNAEVVKSA